MKTFARLLALWLTGAVTLCAQTPAADQMKHDLLGHTMGGRQRSWKFQTIDQIRELTIETKTEKADRRTYLVALRLQATNAPATYAAHARVVYTYADGVWKLDHVGLLSLEKVIEPTNRAIMVGIKELTIEEKTETADQRIYTIALRLQAPMLPPRNDVQARVAYTKSAASWKLHQVGLLSLGEDA